MSSLGNSAKEHAPHGDVSEEKEESCGLRSQTGALPEPADGRLCTPTCGGNPQCAVTMARE